MSRCIKKVLKTVLKEIMDRSPRKSKSVEMNYVLQRWVLSDLKFIVEYEKICDGYLRFTVRRKKKNLFIIIHITIYDT